MVAAFISFREHKKSKLQKALGFIINVMDRRNNEHNLFALSKILSTFNTTTIIKSIKEYNLI